MGDTDGSSPAVQGRRLRIELRRMRQQAGRTQEQVADAMEWSLSKVIRIENGSVGISTNDLKVLLPYYGTDAASRTDELVVLARTARERSWWSSYKDVASRQLLQLIEYEGTAFIRRNFEPLLIPGLLQTENYARSVIEEFYDQPTKDRVDAMVALRMKRKELLDRTDRPLAFFILDEGVVRRLEGDEVIMRQQVSHLIELAKRPNVTIEIIPFSAGLLRGMQGPFVDLEFPDEADDDLLYVEGPEKELINRDDPEEILAYRQIFERLRAASLGPGGSITFLEGLLPADTA